MKKLYLALLCATALTCGAKNIMKKWKINSLMT